MVLRGICLTLLLLSLVLPGSARADNLQGQLAKIMSQIEAQPDLQVAGEPIFMSGGLIDFYRERNYEPLWRTNDSQGRDQIRTVLGYLERTSGNGLCSADYHLPFFRKILSNFSVEEQLHSLPRLRWSSWYDVLLTDALYNYMLHMIKGRVPAEAIQEGWDLRKPQHDVVQVLRTALADDELDKVLQGFQPEEEAYQNMIRALDRYRDIAAFGGWPTIPPGTTLRPGMVDDRVPLLRTRLLLTGDLLPEAVDNSWLMNDLDSRALRQFQRRHGLHADGVLGERTLAALNVPVSVRVRQIELNLERWRWLPKSLGRRYLAVNIADFSLSAVEAGKVVLTMPVVVGNAYRKTPVFSAGMEYLEFAPYWHVPETILKEDKLPLIIRDPGYIEEHHYELLAWDLETVLEPANIDWERVDENNFPGVLRQKPGPWNPLGRVKFMLPNKFAVYLHDTNEQQLFAHWVRQFSSGCIRLEKPAALALYLLERQGWDVDGVAKAMLREKPLKVYLQERLPVYVLYWTAWVDDAGLVNFREDVYGRDLDLDRALNSTRSACVVHKPELAGVAH